MLLSLRARLYIAFGIVVAVTLLAAGFVFFYPLGGYRDQLATSTLRQVALPIYYNVTLFAPANVSERELIAYLQDLAFQGSALPSAELLNESEIDALVVDRMGNVVWELSGDFSLGGERFAISPATLEPGSSTLTEGVHKTQDGRDFRYIAIPLPGRFAASELRATTLVIALPRDSTQSVIGDLTPRLLIAGGAGLGAAMLAALVLSGSVYRPLQRVARAAVSVSRGHYREKVPVEGPSEARALAENFNAMTDAVQRSQQTLRDFLANVSHELKTPLTSIRGFSQALRDGTVQGREAEDRAVRVIEAESRRLLHLVEELLDLSRIESGQIQMSRSPVRVEELFHHCADVFSLRSQETGVRLEVEDGHVPAIMADFDRMEQVLGNLLDNAFRHTPRGGSIRMTSRHGANGLIEIAVADSGEGIPAADLGGIFDRFYRGTEAGLGAGLGLAISKQIVRAHGGEIWAESAQGEGTRFAFTVPIAPAGDGPPAGAAKT